MTVPLRILVVDDSEDDAELIVRELRRAGYEPDWNRVDTAEAMKTALAGREWDVVISDHSMPYFSSAAALEVLQKSGLDVPFIIVSGTIGEQLAIDAMRAGAHDYVMKSNLPRLAAAVERELREARVRRKREEAEAALAREQERFRMLIENALDITAVLADDGTMDYISPSIEAVLGYEAREMIGMGFVDLVHPHERDRVSVILGRLRAEPEAVVRLEVRLRHIDQSWRVLEAVGSNTADNPAIGGYVLNLRDVTEREEAEEQLKHHLLHDSLTELPNRTLLMDRIEAALARSRRNEEHACAVFVIDIDRFELINSSLGSQLSDDLLVKFAERLREAARPGDTVARVVGDRFALLLEDVSGMQEAITEAEKVIESVRPPFSLSGQVVFVTASVGVGLSEQTHDSSEHILRDASAATYKAKCAGGNRYEVFASSMRHAAVSLLRFETDLRRGLERSEFLVYYQPIVSLSDGTIAGCEALARWKRPALGLISPADFIPTAEATGMIVPIGEQVLKMTCHQVKEWQSAGLLLPLVAVAVNLSVRQFRERNLLAQIRTALDESGLDPAVLNIEVTESALVDDEEGAAEILGSLAAMGLHLAIDDFGTGYSSLARLKDFPFGTLKIDRSFIFELETDPDAAKIATAIVALAHSLGKKVVAEGVETHAQLDFLKDLGCEMIQGHLFSPPVPPEEFEKMLRAEKRLKAA